MARGRRRNQQNRFGMALAFTVVVLLMIVVSAKSVSLMKKASAYREREEALRTEIAAEEERGKEIEEYEKYTKTRKYIEEVAKEKLGLVYEGEIIFREEKE